MKLKDSIFRLLNPFTSLDEMSRLDRYVPDTDPGSLIDMGTESAGAMGKQLWDQAVQAVTGKDADGNPVPTAAKKDDASTVTAPQTPTAGKTVKKTGR